jgi:hypothetical protein
MTTFQIVSLVVLAGVAVWTYAPRISLPSLGKPSSLKQIQQVLAIRDSSKSPAVVEACNALLQALLK